MKTSKNVKMVWRLKDIVDYKVLEQYGFKLHTKYYMRKITPGSIGIDFIYVATDDAVLPRVVSGFYYGDDITEHIKDLIDAGLVETIEESLSLVKKC